MVERLHQIEDGLFAIFSNGALLVDGLPDLTSVATLPQLGRINDLTTMAP